MNERDLFMATLQIEGAAERSAYLDRACAGEAALRQRIDALLTAFERAGSFLQQPSGDPRATSDDPGETSSVSDPVGETGAVIDPYKLIEPIGEGGMGTVWMAQQAEPVKRVVALKLIKFGMDSRSVLARFEAERQALALIDHPNIAKVLDAGAAADGRPYFVMELVNRVVRPLALCFALVAVAVGTAPCRSGDESTAPKGLRVFSAGHSFHVFVPGILTDIARSAGIKDHKHVGTSSIGGSRTIQHWDQPDDKNKTKAALKEGNVDVLTLSPIFHPDAGIDNFVKLGLEHNPNLRVAVQAFWLPFDVYDRDYQKKRPAPVDRNTRTLDEMKKVHADYFKSVDEQVVVINKTHRKPVCFVVPVGQAAILLRGKIIEGKAPGLQKQEELFTDAIGHATEPLRVLTAYCHFAVIYRRSPVGLPTPAALKNTKKGEYDEKLNALLQELAWEAVTAHPLSGVKAEAKR